MSLNDELYTTDYLISKGRIKSKTAMVCKRECPCGKPIYRNWKLTKALCIDPYCKYHLKYKAETMFKYLGVKGLGAETCGMYIQRFKTTNHFELIPYVFKSKKPRLYLWEVALLTGIPGYSTKLEEMMIGYNTFHEYFSKEKNIPRIIHVYKNILMRAQSYFVIRPSLAKECITVMITGNITGYSPRDKFIDACNDIVGDVIRVKLVGKGKSNRDYLITEDPSTGTGKVLDAIDAGINVVHPSIFIDELEKIYFGKIGVKNTYYNEEEED